ncbi:flagellar export chaperone FliS [Exilibacterium tricleocarpae]|uniref:Flagellar secretion chaperone FliS n=1 Tax=Exilibacterium tricleocarpae TaxID=2591008 RepID=A0A545U3Y1_9GAMM|nr:flagellar export chaperone FliS [Exilibacterium tricleocarpae]TQV84156.1 flagellar export chaperone FliS [Exilibacterium tricleocarpae]
MSIAATQAAAHLQQQADSISPYEVIALLLDGALERLQQAKTSFCAGNLHEAQELVNRTIAIVNGLRASLDMEKGGEVAVNLNAVYEYVAARLQEDNVDDPMAVLDEASRLLAEVKQGWDGIADTGPVRAVG